MTKNGLINVAIVALLVMVALAIVASNAHGVWGYVFAGGAGLCSALTVRSIVAAASNEVKR